MIRDAVPFGSDPELTWEMVIEAAQEQIAFCNARITRLRKQIKTAHGRIKNEAPHCVSTHN